MMRLARRAALPVVFLLLASATTAYAEGAWVLWASSLLPSGEQVWGTIGAYSPQDGGQTRLRKFGQEVDQTSGTVRTR
jgi:hypothetical protein